MKTSSSPADSIDPGNDSRRRGHEYHQESDGKYSFAAQLVHLQHPILKTYTIRPRYIIPAVFSVKQERNMFGDLFLFSELSIISDVFWYEKRMRSGFYRILAAPCPISEELICPTAWLPEAACTIMVLVSLMKAAVLVVCQLL